MPDAVLEPAEPPRRRRRFVRAALVLVCLAVFALVALECFLRLRYGLGDPPVTVTDTFAEYRAKPDGHYRRLGNRIDYNAYSMRSGPIAVPKPAGERRVLVLGDSVVNGGAYTDQADLATSILQRRLADAFAPATAYVGNVSAGSWGPQNLLGYVREFGLFDADVVVIVLSSHDAFDELRSLPRTADQPIGPQYHTALSETWDRIAPAWLRTTSDAQAADPPPNDRGDSAPCLAALGELIDAIRAAGAVPIVALHYERGEIAPGAGESEGHRLLRKVCASRGIEPVSFRDALTAVRAAGGEPFRDAIHPSVAGQAAIAGALGPAVGAALERATSRPAPAVAGQLARSGGDTGNEAEEALARLGGGCGSNDVRESSIASPREPMIQSMPMCTPSSGSPFARSEGEASVRRRGSVLVWAVLAIGVLGGVAALTFDMSQLRTAKGELQAAVESAAMNGANGLQDGSFVAKTQAAAAENRCLGTSISIPSSDIVAGNWNNSVFIANGTPRNALRVTAKRTSASGNPIPTVFANLIGRSAADVYASTTIAVVNRSDYQWTGIDSASVAGGNAPFTIGSYDATNPTAPESTTRIESNGPVSVTGPVRIFGDVQYGTTCSVDSSSKVTGTTSRSTTPLVFPSGGVASNLVGSATTSQTYPDMTYTGFNTTAGGTYVVRNITFSNCTVTFTGPTTIVITGNLNLTNASIYTHKNLPANLKIISAGKNTSMYLGQLQQILYADFYAPETNFTLDAPDKTYGISGRGVFKTMTIYGKGADAPIRYDRSLASNRLSTQAIIVK